MDLPENRLYTIGEAAKAVGVSISTLRRWDKEGKVKIGRKANGYRCFTQAELNLLRKTQTPQEIPTIPPPTVYPTLPKSARTYPRLLFLTLFALILLLATGNIFLLSKSDYPHQAVLGVETFVAPALEESAPLGSLLSKVGSFFRNNPVSSFALTVVQKIEQTVPTSPDLTVSGKASIAKDIEGLGDLKIKGTATIGKIITGIVDPYLIENDGSVQNTLEIKSTGNIKLEPGTSGSGSVDFGGNSLSNVNNITSQGTISGSTLKLSNNSTIGGNETIGGNLTLTGTLNGNTFSSTSLIFSGSSPSIYPTTANTQISLNASGTGAINIGNSSKGDIYIGGGSTSGTYCLITNSNGSLNCASDITTGGNLHVNGGTIATSQTSFNLLNDTATTINLGGGATTLKIGATTGTTTVNNALTATGALTGSSTLSITGTSTLTGATTLSSTLAVTGATTLTGALTANGNITLGSSSSQTAAINARITTSIIPNATGNVDLGSSSLKWNNLYTNTINTSSTNTSGQAVFTQNPASTAITDASVLINPTTVTNNGSALLGIAVGGTEKARIDNSGNINIQGVYEAAGSLGQTVSACGASQYLGGIAVTGGIITALGSCTTVSSSWSGLTNPSANLSLSMGAYTTTFTWNAATGASTNLFTLTDTASNTGTGYLLSSITAASSNLKPFQVQARGNAIIDTTAAGVLTLGNSTLAQNVQFFSTSNTLSSAGTLTLAGNLILGTNPSSTGAIRLPNGTLGQILARNNANTGDRNLIFLNTSDQTVIGDNSAHDFMLNSTSGAVLFNTDNAVDIGASGATRPRTGYFGTALAVGTNPAAAGALRIANTQFVTSRNAANSADFNLIGVTAGNQVAIGDASASSIGFFNNLIAGSDNTYDIGAVNATRPRTGYFGTAMRIGASAQTTYPLEVNGATGNGIRWYDGTISNFLGSNSTVGIVGTLSNHSLQFFTNNLAHAKLDTSGNFIISGTLTQNGSPDLAENVLVQDQTIGAGDIVAIDENNTPSNGSVYDNFYAVKTTKSYQMDIIGVISTNPGIILNSPNAIDTGQRSASNQKPLALSGRVPVKFSIENGSINPGDHLTSSGTLPGYAMKATKAGRTIGIALQGATSNGEILVFVNPSWYDPQIYLTADGNLNVNSITAKSVSLQGNNLSQVIGLSDKTVTSSASPSPSSSPSPTPSPTPVILPSILSRLSSLEILTRNLVLSTQSAVLSTSSASFDNLTITKKLLTQDLGITGVLTQGLLSIKGLDNTISSSSATINTISNDLYLQNLGVGGVNFLNGKVLIDKNGNLTAQKLNVSSNSAGSTVIPAGTTSVTVSTSALTPQSLIFVTPVIPVAVGASQSAATTISITLKDPLTQNLKVNWWIVN